MRIHLPLFLRKSLLSLLSSVAVLASTSASFADIYEWTGATNNDLHNSTNFDPNFTGGWTDIWAGTTTNVIKFTDRETTNKAPNISFYTLSLSGIVVESGASGYVMQPNNNNDRNINFRATTEADAAAMGGISGQVNLLINNDFSLGINGKSWKNIYFNADANFAIATGKTMTVYARTLQGSDEFRNMNITGGGSLVLNNLSVSDNVLSFTNLNWNISENSSLNLSAITTGTTVNMGNVSINSGSIILAAEVTTFNGTLSVGANGGTISGATSVTLGGSIAYTAESITALSFAASNVVISNSLMFSFNTNLTDGTYTLLSTTGTLSGDLSSLNNSRIAHYFYDAGSLKVTIGGEVADLTWKGGNGTWGAGLTTDSEWNSDTALNDYHFFNSDKVTIGTASDTAETTGTISLVSNVSPGEMTVNGAGTWTIATDGGFGIQGDGSLTKNGSGTLILNTDNTFTGGTTLNAGTIVLGTDTALGSGNLTFNGGAIKYGEGITTDLSDKLVIGEDVLSTSNQFNLDLNGNTVTWATTVNNLTWLSLTNSSDTQAILNYAAPGTGSVNYAISNNVILNLTTATAANITGAGTLNLSNTSGNTTLGSLTGFTGTINRNQTGTSKLIFSAANTEDERFNLNTGTDTSDKQAVIIGSNSIGNGTLFIQNLSGNANLTASNGSAGNRSLNILMTEDNVFNGNFHSANGATDIRWGTITIGGAHQFTWTGQTVNTSGNYTSLGTNANLVITGGATMVFASNEANTGGAQWADEIRIDADSTLLIARTDEIGFVQQAGDSNAISGEGKVVVTGNLTLAGNNTYSGGTTIQSGSVTVSSIAGLGTGLVTMTGGELDASGLAIANQITISDGTLKNMGQYAGTVAINQHLNANNVSTGNINLGGLSGNKITELNLGYDYTTNQIGSISGVSGNINVSNATLGANLGSLVNGGTAGTGCIEFSSPSGTLTITDSLNLAITNDLAAHMLDSRGDIVLQLTNGGLVSIGDGVSILVDSQYNSIKNLFNFTTSGNGTITLSSGEGNILYVAAGTSQDIVNAADINSLNLDYVVVDGTLNVSLPAAGNTILDLNGLEGTVSTAMIDTSGSESNAILMLNQSGKGDAVSSYAGSIQGNAQLQKNDDYKQIIGGSVSATGIKVAGGELVINGNTTLTDYGWAVIDSNAILTLNGLTNTIKHLTNNGSFFLGGKDSTTTVETLIQGNGSSINFSNGAELVIGSNGFDLTSTITGKGTLTLNNGVLSVGANGSIGNDTSVNLGAQASLNVQNNLGLGALAGTGTVQFANADSSIELGSATNSFSGSFNGAGSINLAGGGTQEFTGVTGSQQVNLGVSNGTLILSDCEFGDLTVGGAARQAGTAHVIFNITNGEKLPNVALSSLNTQGGTLTFNTSVSNLTELQEKALVSVTGDIALNNTQLVLDNNVEFQSGDLSSYSFVLISGDSVSSFTGNSLTVKGLQGLIYNYELEQSGNDIIVNASKAETNVFADAALTQNALAGANLLNESKFIASANRNSTLYALSDAVAQMIQSGNIGTASQTMAAAAGSTLTSYGMAQNNALKDQMVWLRNRTTQMGVNQSVTNEDMPYYNMWVQGTGSYNKLNSSGDESGYTLSTWGGTVGVDVDLSDRVTVGLAFSAQFGDLKASAADHAKGDLDSYYLNGFLRFQDRKWAHTVIVTGVRNDGKLTRTVDYGAGSYDAHSKTNGYGIGAMYELTYDYALNEENTSVLQPLFNASVAHTSMDGFDETGADMAGLKVGKQDMTVATLALGGRWMGVIGSNLFGRESFAEARVNVAQDFGDDRSKVNVGFLGNPNFMQNVQGAKIGTTAIQLGAGLTVPVGVQSSFFIDANADFRSGASSFNGSLGYRYSF